MVCVAPPRIIDPQGLYHVMSRGNFRQRIFLDEPHFEKYIRLLAQVTRRRHWTILDWCLMPNHYHLLIQLIEGGLSEGMRELNGCYARWSNVQTGRTGSGHLVQNRFKAPAVDTERHFWATVRYIALNPVRSNLVERPEDWPWSGYRDHRPRVPACVSPAGRAAAVFLTRPENRCGAIYALRARRTGPEEPCPLVRPRSDRGAARPCVIQSAAG